MEKLTGCPLDNGLTSLCWVAMGLRNDSKRGPGWFSSYTMDVYFTSNMNPEVQNAMALDCISGILQGFLMNPKSMLQFFAKKNASQWSDGTFQSVILNARMFHSDASSPEWLVSFLNAQGPSVLSCMMNVLQTVIYGGLVLWAWVPTMEDHEPQEELLAVILLGGFVFHTVWEAKCQYTLPYYVLVIPLAVLGYSRLAEIFHTSNVRALSVFSKLRLFAPLFLMLLALALSAVLAVPLQDTLTQLLQTP